MGRPGITQKDVEQAANELRSRGKNPTVDNVRELLGTGSKSTITRHLRRWKDEHSPKNENKDDLQNQVSQLLQIMKNQPPTSQNDNVAVLSSSNQTQYFQLKKNYDQLTQQFNAISQKCLYLEQEYKRYHQKILEQEKNDKEINAVNHMQQKRISNLLDQLRKAQLKLTELMNKK